MKYFLKPFVLLAGFAALIVSSSRGAWFGNEGTWTVSPAMTSHYLFRGVERAGPSFQPWIDYSAGPLSFGLWSSFALEDRAFDASDPEIDLYGFYTFRTKLGALSLVPGFYLYTYPDAERSLGGYPATFEPSLAASFPLAGVQLTPRIYYDVMLRGATYELTAAVALPLKTFGTELDLSATAGTFKQTDVARDAVPAVKNWGDFWSVGFAVPFQVTPRSKLTVGLTYSEGHGNFYKRGALPRTINARARSKTAISVSYAITL